jgi:DNA-directed RNA polymerase sigma subunit (sigma70/sigma32)
MKWEEPQIQAAMFMRERGDTFAAIGKRMGVSSTRVNQVLSRAARKRARQMEVLFPLLDQLRRMGL